jgi:peptidoglycan/xylan/chitin deacetylase (PgdA/CDA1 family)
LFALARRLTFRQVRILCYHGGTVSDEHQFNPLLFCPAEHLDRRLAWLRAAGFTFVGLSAAVVMLRAGSPGPRLPLVLTFDDGWSSTANVLGPVVRRHDVLATLYLCTSHFRSGHAVPDVAIGYMAWKAGGGQVRLFGLAPGLDGVYELAEQHGRKAFMENAVSWVNSEPLSAPMAQERLSALASALGLTEEQLGFDSRRFHYVDAEELQLLHESGWAVELHGHEHRYHAGNAQLVHNDLARCRAVLRQEGFSNCHHYCYPSGNHDDTAHAILANEHVQSATTCLPGLARVSQESQLYYLPRFLDGPSIDDVIFEAEMSGFADGVRWLARLVGRGPRPMEAARTTG